MPIPQFSPDVNWGALGREYRTGMFLGTVFEYLAQGFVLALMSRYYSLVKQRKASIAEQVAVAAACAIGVAQMCIHTQANYKNGISNYMQVSLLALEEDWQMRSIWATSSVVWAIGAVLFLWDRKQRLQALSRQSPCALPIFILSSALMAATAASGVAIAIMRSTFAANAIATVTGQISMPEGFDTIKRVLYIHYGLIVASQAALSVVAFLNVREMAETESHQKAAMAKTMYLYYRQLMIAPLAFALAVLLCFIIRPGKNIELIVYLPFSAVSFGNVVSLLNQDALDASTGTTSASSSRTDDMQKFRHSVINPRVLIPLERTEVIAISDKDTNYTPSKIGINRLPYSESTSTVSHAGYEQNEKNSLKRQDSGSIF